MRIAVFFEKPSANARYRAIFPCQEMERRGHTVFWPGHPSFRTFADGGVPKWDLLHIQQTFGPENAQLIRRLREGGVAVSWDTDDDILAAPKGSNSYKRLGGGLLGGRGKLRRHFDDTVAIASAASLMTTTNEHLAGVYRDAGVEHVAVIENFLGPDALDGARRRHQGTVIGIVAADEHGGDLRALGVAKALQTVLDRHDGVRIVAIGLDLGLSDHRYQHVLKVEPERLIDYEREWDIGIAPLADTPFNRSRSNVKLKEYAAAGAMWLASPVGPYAGMGEAQGGLLVPDGEWADAIGRLVEDGDRRRALAERARAWARTETIRKGGDGWEAAFRGAVLRTKRRAGQAAAR